MGQAKWAKQISVRKLAKEIGETTHCRKSFLRKNQREFLAKLDFATHSPYIRLS